MTNHAVEQSVIRVFGVQVRWIGVARNSSKGLDVSHGQCALDVGRVAYVNLIVGIVLKPFVLGVVGGVGDFFHMFSLAIKPLRGYLHLHKSFVLSCQKMHLCIRS